jgi:hypothetical protein
LFAGVSLFAGPGTRLDTEKREESLLSVLVAFVVGVCYNYIINQSKGNQMSKINWDIVDRTVFAQFRLATTDELIEAYISETFLDSSRDEYLVSLFEMIQGRFNSQNNRTQRAQLAMVFIKEALDTKARIKAGASQLWSDGYAS